MKFYSPFVIVTVMATLLLFSCSKQKQFDKQTTQTTDSIYIYIKNANATNSNAANAHLLLEKAYTLALQSKNDSIRYKVVTNQVLLANSSFISEAPAFLEIMHTLVKSDTTAKKYGYYQSRMADYFATIQQYDKAFKYFNNSKSIYEAHKDSTNLVYNLVRLSWLYCNINNYNEAEEMAVAALKIVKGSKNQKDRAYVYLSLGNAYVGSQQYDKAIAIYKAAEKISSDKQYKARNQNNTAYVYSLNGNYNKSISIFSKILKEHVFTDSLEQASVMDNLGFAKFKLDSISGLKEMNHAMLLRKSNSDSSALAASYRNLAHYYTKSNRIKAIDYAKKAYAIATKYGVVDERIAALDKLCQLVPASRASFYYAKNDGLKDSIHNFRIGQGNKYAMLRYELATTKNETQMVVKKNDEQNSKQKFNLLIGMFLLVCCGITLYFLYRDKYKKEKQKEVYNTETRIAKKVHDELANDVYHAMTFAQTKDMSEANREELLDKLEDIYSRTRNISRENSSINTELDYPKQLKEMIAGYSSVTVNVVALGIDTIDWMALDSNKKITVYRVIQEWLVNMKKHSKCSRSAITFKKIKNNLHIEYSDDGVGQTATEIILGNGLQNVENRIQAIKGTSTFENLTGKGFRSGFHFPI